MYNIYIIYIYIICICVRVCAYVRACVRTYAWCVYGLACVYIYICENVRGNEDEFACVRACVRACEHGACKGVHVYIICVHERVSCVCSCVTVTRYEVNKVTNTIVPRLFSGQVSSTHSDRRTDVQRPTLYDRREVLQRDM